MNLAHRWLCRSGYWKKAVETYIVPWVLEGLDMGRNVLEVGPGPGVTTDLLRRRVEHLTCVEIDHALAHSLARPMSGQNVTVVHQDATAMSFPEARFDGALCFTMLHHVPTAAAQDRLLSEARRVLCPGGVFVGLDGMDSPLFRLFHLGDEYTPIDPDTLAKRLQAAGFTDLAIEQGRRRFRFCAKRPKVWGLNTCAL